MKRSRKPTTFPLAIAALFVLPTMAATAPTANLRASRLEVRPSGGDPAAAVKSLGAADTWVAWSVPMVEGQGEACCYTGGSAGGRSGRRGCALEKRGHGLTIQGSDEGSARAAADPGALVIFARLEAGMPREMKVLSESCPMDAGEARVVWLDGVDPARSVDWLKRQALDGGKRHGAGDEALVALALHGDPRADQALAELSAPATPFDVREDAIFWLGQARGRKGYEQLRRILTDETSAKVLEKVAFSLSQCSVPEAGTALENMARRHPDAEVREEAIFWFGQRGDAGVAAKLLGVAQEDADLEVRKKAVFALSQLEDGDGVTPLLQLVRTGREAAIRKEALFWLGQSDDPRAMESLEALLLR